MMLSGTSDKRKQATALLAIANVLKDITALTTEQEIESKFRSYFPDDEVGFTLACFLFYDIVTKAKKN